MSLIETDSLVLKSYNLAEADKVIVLLTRDHGVVRGVAKGVKRLKSKFGSSLEPFSLVKITYYEKEGQELVAIEHVELVRSHFAAASDPEFLRKFSYLCDILITLSPPHDPNETLYRMARACIEAAAEDPGALYSTGVYFELWLLRLSGFLPDWSKCENCRRVFGENESAAVLPNFHFVCEECSSAGTDRTLNIIGRDIASSALRSSPTAFAAASAARQRDLEGLSKILKQLIARSIGREVAAEKPLGLSK